MGERGNGLAVEVISLNPEDLGSCPCFCIHWLSFISVEHVELLSSTFLLVLCYAWLVTCHCGFGLLSTSEMMNKHCGYVMQNISSIPLMMPVHQPIIVNFFLRIH